MPCRKILIEEMPNTDYLNVHFSFQLGTTVHGASFLRPLRSYRDNWRCLDVEAQRLVASLFDDVEGTDHVTVYPHKVTIEKGRLFDFVSISVEIAQSVKGVFGDLDVEIKPLS